MIPLVTLFFQQILKVCWVPSTVDTGMKHYGDCVPGTKVGNLHVKYKAPGQTALI